MIRSIQKISLPTPYPVGKVNAYLLDGPEPTLVDTGVLSVESLTVLEQRLAELGRRPEELRRILLSHDHPDHAGSAIRLAGRAGCPIFLHQRCTLSQRWREERAERYREFVRRCGIPSAIMEQVLVAFRGAPSAREQEEDEVSLRRLRGGEVLPCGGFSLSALATPGHSPGHLCFLEPESGALFSGDTLLLHITPNPVLFLDPENGFERMKSLLAYLQTLERLSGLSIRRGYPGHGRDIDDVPGLIQKNRGFIERRKRSYAKLLGEAPMPVHLLTQRVFGELDPTNQYLALSETLGYLDLLEAEGRARVEWAGDPIQVVGVGGEDVRG